MILMENKTYHELPGIHGSPNIQTDPDLYEIENYALDPEGKLEAAMQAVAPWKDRVFLDLGAGTGYYIPRFHEEAQHVFAVEPHTGSRLRIFERVARLQLERVSVLTGSAEFIPLRDRSIDILHARFAYFFAPKCEPGLIELERVMKPGGTAFIIDNNLRSGEFTTWLRKAGINKAADADTVENFWRDRGFTITRVATAYKFNHRAEMEAVVKLEFGEKLAPELLAGQPELQIDAHFCLYHHQY